MAFHLFHFNYIFQWLLHTVICYDRAQPDKDDYISTLIFLFKILYEPLQRVAWLTITPSSFERHQNFNDVWHHRHESFSVMIFVIVFCRHRHFSSFFQSFSPWKWRKMTEIWQKMKKIWRKLSFLYKWWLVMVKMMTSQHKSPYDDDARHYGTLVTPRHYIINDDLRHHFSSIFL